jgi:hypothetical protein
MRRGAGALMTVGLVGAAAACSTLAGIEDLQLTGSADAATDGTTPGDSGAMDGDGSSSGAVTDSGTGDAGGEASSCASGSTRCSGDGVETCVGGQWGAPVACASGTCADGGVCSGACSTGQFQCSGNGVQPCDNGQWGSPVACVNQTCDNGECTGTCAPGETNPIACGHCGTDTQTCGAGGAWTSGACAGQGCVPGDTQACNTNGMQTCTSACTWGSCSCGVAVCTPGHTQCSGTDVEACGGCGQWGSPTACASGTCSGDAGACMGTCTPGQKQCSGNGVQTCGGNGSWGAPVACTNQTCVSDACTGVCAPGQTHPVVCGQCGTDTQTCSASGTWQNATCADQGVCASGTAQPCNTYGMETCSTSCSWGSCSCASTPVCTPDAVQCSGSEVQTCDGCGQWGNPVACATGMTCSSGTCVAAATDCPGSFLLCDGFESGGGTLNTTTWPSGESSPNTTVTVDTTNPHRGAYSLHIHVDSLDNGIYVNTFIRDPTVASGAPATQYYRAWFWLSVLTGSDDDALMTIGSGVAGESASSSLGFGTAGFLADGVSNTDIDGGDYNRDPMATPLTLGGDAGAAGWTCLELELDTSYQSPNPYGLLQVWKDTDSTTGFIPDLSGTAQLYPLTSASFGLSFQAPSMGHPASPAIDLYIDDIAISTSFIPCSD